MTGALVLELRETYLELYPTEAVQTLERCTHEEVLVELEGITSRQAMFEVIDRVSSIRATAIFRDLPSDVQKWILESAPPSLLIRILHEVDTSSKAGYLAMLDHGARIEVERLLDFPIDSAAALMDSAIGSIRQDMTVGEALECIELESDRRESVVFVVNDENELVGRVFMQDLALARNQEPLLQYMRDVETTVNVSMTRTALATEMEGNREDTVPVVDENGRLFGVVHADALRDLAEGDATADLQRMVGASVDERALTSPFKAISHRLPWLLVNLATAFLAASVVGLFENTIAMFTMLAILLPVIAGQSGNSGSQAMAVAIRGLALREIGVRQWYRVAWKETCVGTFNGIAIAVVCSACVYFWSQSTGLGLVIFTAMVTAMVLSGIAGALVPVFLTRLGQDPATASSIILTTITDVVSFFAFLGIATLLANWI